MLAGIALSEPMFVTYGAALVCGVALSRTLTLLSVARARAAGFEMSWRTGDRNCRATRLKPFALTAELRNRDTLATLFGDLTVAHSPHLDITVSPTSGEVPALGSLVLTFFVRPLRVGHHGIHGLTLETIRAPGLHTVPLGFTNPFVVSVLPRPIKLTLPGAFGGVGRTSSLAGGSSRVSGDGAEFRELREHRPGDPFKRIAWKASARRGRLLTVEKESDERGVVWLFVDGSSDSFSGLSGQAPIDHSLDQAAEIATAHLAHGDLVGLCIVGSRQLTRVPLGRGPRHRSKLLSALAFEVHTAHADRGEWEEHELVGRVLEHARGLTEEAALVHPDDHSRVARIASALILQAPVSPLPPFATKEYERLLRTYLLAFGIHPPPRGLSDRNVVERNLAQCLLTAQRQKPRPTGFYVFGQPPTLETPREVFEALTRVRRGGAEIRFLPQQETLSEAASNASAQERMTRDALVARLHVASEQGLRRLATLGVKVVRSGERAQRTSRRTSARSMMS